MPLQFTPIPDHSTLKKLLDYNPLTGILTWKSRDASMFSDGYMDAQGRANNWNSKMAGKEAFGYVHNTGYKQGTLMGKVLKAHRVAWKLHYGEDPVEQIDHINGDRSDNRIENLRCVSDAENKKNAKLYSNNSSGVTGIHWLKEQKKWRVRIGGSKGIHIGCYATLDEAKAARKEAEAKYGYPPNHGR